MTTPRVRFLFNVYSMAAGLGVFLLLALAIIGFTYIMSWVVSRYVFLTLVGLFVAWFLGRLIMSGYSDWRDR